MEEFRRFIVRMAELLTVLMVIVVTLAAGIAVSQTVRMMAIAGGAQSTGGYQFFGFLIGAGVGFVIAAFASAFVFTLFDIAANTRQTAELLNKLQQAGFGGERRTSEQTWSTTGNPAVGGATLSSSIETWITRDGERLSAAAIEVLNRAMSLGYAVTMDGNREITIESKGGSKSFCKSSAEIMEQGQWLK